MWPGSASARRGNCPTRATLFWRTMYLLYVDASGTPQLSDTSSNHYVLTGIAVHEGTWFALEKRLSGLKKRYCFPGEDFELHAMDFNTVISEQNEIAGFEAMNHSDRRRRVNKLRADKLRDLARDGRLPKLRKLKREFEQTSPFVHLTRQERSDLYRDSVDLIAEHQGLTIFVEAIDKRHESIANLSIDPVTQAFEQVITRFDAFLERRKKWRELSRTKSVGPSTGLIVIDQDKATEKSVRDQFDTIRVSGHRWGHLRNVVDAPFFVSSARCSGLQVVDICAYAIRRYLDKGAISGSHEESHFKKIHALSDRGGGRLHGFRHFVRRGSCSCLVCRERGESAADQPLGNPGS